MESLHKFVNLAWPTIRKPSIFMHNEGYFVVRFRYEDEYNRVVNTRALAMGKHHVIIRLWTKDFDLHKMVLRVILV